MNEKGKLINDIGFNLFIALLTNAVCTLASLFLTVFNKYISIQKIPDFLPFIFSITGFLFILIIAINIFRLKTQYQQLDTQRKKVGIIDIIQQKDMDFKKLSKIPEKLYNAKIIKVFFNTGHSFFGAHSKTIRKAINENKTKEVNVLLAKEDSKFLDDIAIIEKDKDTTSESSSFKKQIQDVKDELDDINKGINKNVIEIRYYDTEFRLSMILIESIKKEKWGWITLSLPPYTSVDSISFEIESNDKDDNIYNLCEDHFNAVWDKLKPK